MTLAFTCETRVDAPPERGWAALTDWDHAPRWMAGIDDARASGPTRPGMQVRFTARGRERRAEVVPADPATTLVLRSVQGGVTADYAYVLVADGGATRVALEADCRTRGPWTLVAPVLRRVLARTDGGQFDDLRTWGGRRRLTRGCATGRRWTNGGHRGPVRG